MTYLYETIPAKDGEAVKRYEFQQSMKDAPLTKHPETGEPIRRVILGGWGLITPTSTSSGSNSSSCGCGPGQSCG